MKVKNKFICVNLYGNDTICWDFDDKGFEAASYYGPLEPQEVVIEGTKVWVMPKGYGQRIKFLFAVPALERQA
jgi:hypothetical protein